VERLVTGALATLVGGGIGVLLARVVWEFAGARVECDMASNGHCPSPGGFLPFGLVGGTLGGLATLLALFAFIRTLD
jgi:hypothetical protein